MQLRIGLLFKLVVVACLLAAVFPLPTSAATTTHSNDVYGFNVTWEDKWDPNQTISKRGEAVVDGVSLTWGAGIMSTYVGFLSGATTLEGIASDYMEKFLFLDSDSNVVERAQANTDGTFSPTVVFFPGGSSFGTLLIIYPYELPIGGTAFVEAWMFPENVNNAELDRAYGNVSFQLPQTVAEQGTYPVQTENSSSQNFGAQSCGGYEEWRIEALSIHDRMVEAIENFRADISLPGLWFQAALNMASGTISNLSHEMLTLEELPIGLDAMGVLSLALSNYGSALRNLDVQMSGAMPQNPQLIQNQMTLGDQNASAFASELLALDAKCGI
jgi:hypothetical protein